jgi:hypothetical protein
MIDEQAKKMGYPPVLLTDWRPLAPLVILFILNHDVAEQVTKASKQFNTSTPKHPLIQDLAPLVGAKSLVTLDVSVQPQLSHSMHGINTASDIGR